MDNLVYFYPEGHAAHAQFNHPERPERIETGRQALQEAGWWDAYPKLAPLALSSDVLSMTHDAAYLRELQAACRRGYPLDADTYTTPASWDLAVKAAGGAVAVANAVWERQAQRGFALTRPPGHHATHSQGMGFCLLNNVAIAANYLAYQPDGRGNKAGRLAIVDLDLHHGNGTQDIFWERQDVFYLSTHQWPFYPGTGSLKETGGGPGKGFTANFPLPPYTGDRGFRAVMDELILPLLKRFEPEMLLVSLGFDPHWRDPLGNLMLTAQGLGGLVRSLIDCADENCAGRIALFLEGGYDLGAGVACIQAAVAALLHRPWQDTLGPCPYSEALAWPEVVRASRQVWNL